MATNLQVLDHSKRDHALCSASGVERGMACVGSVSMGEKVPKPPSSIYAEEGTKAHELIEKILTPIVFHWNKNQENIWDASAEMDFVLNGQYPKDMWDHVIGYCQLVWENIVHYQPKKVMLEHRIWLDKKLNMFSTPDCFYALKDEEKKVLVVWDYKHGKGHAVEAFSPQLIYYACAIQQTYPQFEFDEFWLNIYQPRAEHEIRPHRQQILIKDEIDSWTLAFKNWGKDAQALLGYDAKTLDLKGHLTAGDHCLWCPAIPICPAYARRTQELAGMDFMDAPELLLPAETKIEDHIQRMYELDVKQVAKLLSVHKDIETFFKRLKQTATAYILNGQEIPGWKVVKGRSVRKFKKNIKQVEKGLKKLGIKDPYDHSLRGIGSIETELKTLGVKNTKGIAISAFVEMSAPPLVLAIASDKREGLTGLDVQGLEFEDISEDN